MDRKILYKFFEGDATPEEKENVKRWLEKSDSHRTELLKEREFFDALILSGKEQIYTTHVTSKKKTVSRTILLEISKIAAVIAIMVLVGFYFYSQKMNVIQLATNTMVVPAGQRANLVLPDGTNVWLNASSQITYPAYFTRSTREIELDGEAYFDVAYNQKQPFIVRTEKYDIEVLGTKFNVEAYTDSEDFSTALMEGSVEITNKKNQYEKLILSPNEKGFSQNGKLTAALIDDFDIYRWREGLLCFKPTNLVELMQKLEKYFGIQIVIENPEIQNTVLGGKFRISDGIDNALRVLQKEGKYTFERNREDTTIYIK